MIVCSPSSWRHLLVDYLLDHPVELSLHEREGVRLRDGLDVQVTDRGMGRSMMFAR